VFKQSGFTLIELMITVTVISILAAIAIPSYSDYVTRSRIVEATGALSDLRVRMEQWFQDQRTYVGGPACIAPATPNFSYTCSPAATATTFTVTATGTGTMNGFVYTINQNGARATSAVKSGWSGAGSACWVLKKSGTC
jgi:type IV pilus assembly protein PilE